MVLGRIFAAITGVCLGAMIMPAAVTAGSLGSVDGLPFFGRPYPYYYVYRRPRMECYDLQYVETPVGPRLRLAWICGSPVIAKY